MLKFCQKYYVQFKTKMDGLLRNEKGGMSLEWLGIGLLVVFIIGTLLTVFQSDKFFEGKVREVVTNLFNIFSESPE